VQDAGPVTPRGGAFVTALVGKASAEKSCACDAAGENPIAIAHPAAIADHRSPRASTIRRRPVSPVQLPNFMSYSPNASHVGYIYTYITVVKRPSR
jgi:hypothetical protein